MITLARPGEPTRDEDDPRDPGYPEFIVCAARWLAELIGAAGDDGYTIRADVSRREARRSPWPRWVFSRDQALGLLESLVAASRETPKRRLYPISLWVIPRDRADLEEQIDTFRNDPLEGGLIADLMDAGVVRFGLLDTDCEIIAEQYLGDRVIGWLRSACEATKDSRVEWNVRPAP